jgi:hypothetical protein
MEFIKTLKNYGPLLFGVGFLTPLIAQSLDAVALTAPFGISNLAFGFVVGISLGVVAKLRGRWV